MKTLISLAMLAIPAFAITTITVGSGKEYATPALGIAAAVSAQGVSCAPIIVEVYAGTYSMANQDVQRACAQPIILRNYAIASFGNRRNLGRDETVPMPKLRNATSTDQVFKITGSYLRVEGFEIEHDPSHTATNYGLVWIGDYSSPCTVVSSCPHHVVFDRNYIHSGAQQTGFMIRGISVMGFDHEIANNYISEIKADVDSQAIFLGQAGRVKIWNNYLEAAGENIMFGGAANGGQSFHPITGLAQRGFIIAGNLLAKKAEWYAPSGTAIPTGDCLWGSYYKRSTNNQWYFCNLGTWETTGTSVSQLYRVKNLFEMKDGQGVELIGNILEVTWQDAQSGWAILLNQSAGSPTVGSDNSVRMGTEDYNISDVRIRGNIIREAATGLSIGNLDSSPMPDPRDGDAARNRVTRLTVEHNNWLVGKPYLRVQPQITRLWTIRQGEDLVFRRNTSYFQGEIHLTINNGDDTFPNLRGTNIFAENVLDSIDWSNPAYVADGQPLYAQIAGGGNACGWGTALPVTGASVTFTKNAVAGPGPITTGCPGGAIWPADHVTGANIAAILTNPSAGDYTAKTGGVAKAAAADGADLGADQAMIAALTAGAISGAANPSLEFRVHGARLSGSTVTAYLVAPSTSACTVTAAATESGFASPVGSVSQSRTGRVGSISITSASAARYVRAVCGDVHMTVPIGL